MNIFYLYQENIPYSPLLVFRKLTLVLSYSLKMTQMRTTNSCVFLLLLKIERMISPFS